MIILLLELIGYFFLFMLGLLILGSIIVKISETNYASVRKSRSKALSSVVEKMNYSERLSQLSEIHKKPFLQRTKEDHEMEAILSKMIKKEFAKQNTNSK